MATFERHVDVDWKGPVMEGGGEAKAGAGATVVRATITADKGEAGIKIPSSKLEVTAYGLKGLDASQFIGAAKEAEGRCPVSNAYRGTMQISVDAKVA
jgi:organic hydroperoxide reductase OsmC/OhrA